MAGHRLGLGLGLSRARLRLSLSHSLSVNRVEQVDTGRPQAAVLTRVWIWLPPSSSPLHNNPTFQIRARESESEKTEIIKKTKPASERAFWEKSKVLYASIQASRGSKILRLTSQTHSRSLAVFFSGLQVQVLLRLKFFSGNKLQLEALRSTSSSSSSSIFFSSFIITAGRKPKSQKPNRPGCQKGDSLGASDLVIIERSAKSSTYQNKKHRRDPEERP